ncbi:Gfo/Idh/MocA family oxidoreductase [Parabacteroides sp. OttesenSCG-928-G07]|nr:Gfo/Idh/MocA family oxidoreductase [Parabacteroides sp. OttesenSCG-928-G21]MDL2277730.1 Gfo/Idh/MocA family oxidoreductase [Parabacteroides sp. OttesenSCG-928-G07]
MRKLLNENKLSRRKFIATTAAIGMVTVVPRSVLGKGFIAPSDKITLVNIGCGYQGLSEIGVLLRCPQIEIVGVADPNRQSNNYIGWSYNGLRNNLRRLIDEPNWLEGITGHPGGRDVMKDVISTFYKKNRPGWNSEIPAEEDYREMLDRMRDVDAVKIIPCDHLHSYIAVDCFKRGKHQIMHKPLGNKMLEAMKVVDVATSSQHIATHLMAYNSSSNNGINQTKAWIDAGAIGKLREIHNWSGRPFWPQYPDLPTDRPPIPRDFNWDLWLGPAQMREYSPKYTNACFRGWFEFGAGSIADMGIYSMIPVFNKLGLNSAISASSRFSRVYKCDDDLVPAPVVNTWSFPDAAAYRFELPYKNGSGSIFFTWHDGGMKPNVPFGYKDDDLPLEGMMFIGEKGTIVGGFNGQKPELFGLSSKDLKKYADIKADPLPNQSEIVSEGTPRWLQGWIDNVKEGKKNPGSFEFVRELTESYNLGAVSLQCNGKKLLYDSATRTVTNDAEANKLLSRDTRKGWEFV